MRKTERAKYAIASVRCDRGHVRASTWAATGAAWGESICPNATVNAALRRYQTVGRVKLSQLVRLRKMTHVPPQTKVRKSAWCAGRGGEAGGGARVGGASGLPAAPCP